MPVDPAGCPICGDWINGDPDKYRLTGCGRVDCKPPPRPPSYPGDGAAGPLYSSQSAGGSYSYGPQPTAASGPYVDPYAAGTTSDGYGGAYADASPAPPQYAAPGQAATATGGKDTNSNKDQANEDTERTKKQKDKCVLL